MKICRGSINSYRVSNEICLLTLLWIEKFGILSRKCAPVGKIKNFINKSGLRISKFQSICPPELLLVLGNLPVFSEKASKKIFKRHFSANGAKKILKQNFCNLSWPIIWFSVQKNFFGPTWKFDPKSYEVRLFWNIKFWKNPFCHQM